MTRKDRIRFVEAGYDRVAGAYAAAAESFCRIRPLERFSAEAAPGGAILDAGCGAGIPVARQLSNGGFRVTGIDVSESMLALARKNAPQASFEKASMTELPFADEAFDGVVSCFAIIHVPREMHAHVLSGFQRVLRPGGVLLISSGYSEWEGVEDFYGADMYWSHYAPEKFRSLVEEAGFAIAAAELLADGEEQHFWVLARKA